MEEPILVPTADIGVARVAEAASRLMLPALLHHCPLTDLLAAAATADFRNATVRWWLGSRVDQRATAMVFQVVLDRRFPCPAQGNLSRAQQGSHRSRIHGQKRESTAPGSDRSFVRSQEATSVGGSCGPQQMRAHVFKCHASVLHHAVSACACMSIGACCAPLVQKGAQQLVFLCEA